VVGAQGAVDAALTVRVVPGASLAALSCEAGNAAREQLRMDSEGAGG